MYLTLVLSKVFSGSDRKGKYFQKQNKVNTVFVFSSSSSKNHDVHLKVGIIKIKIIMINLVYTLIHYEIED